MLVRILLEPKGSRNKDSYSKDPAELDMQMQETCVCSTQAEHVHFSSLGSVKALRCFLGIDVQRQRHIPLICRGAPYFEAINKLPERRRQQGLLTVLA